ncbi:hypothetical protein ACW0JT_21775 [Arthrobacter sp. SA17]
MVHPQALQQHNAVGQWQLGASGIPAGNLHGVPLWIRQVTFSPGGDITTVEFNRALGQVGCEIDIATEENAKGMLEVHNAERRDLSQRSAGSTSDGMEDFMDLGEFPNSSQRECTSAGSASGRSNTAVPDRTTPIQLPGL